MGPPDNQGKLEPPFWGLPMEGELGSSGEKIPCVYLPVLALIKESLISSMRGVIILMSGSFPPHH